MREVKAASLLGGGLRPCILGFGRGVALFCGEEGVFLGLFGCCCGFLGLGFFSTRKKRVDQPKSSP